MLARRVQGAARSVCTSADTGPAARLEEGRCVKAAVANAKPVCRLSERFNDRSDATLSWRHARTAAATDRNLRRCV